MLRTLCTAALLLVLTGCDTTRASATHPSAAAAATSTARPQLGACRALAPRDVHRSSNDSPVVGCARAHTAQTFAVGSFPAALTTTGDPALGAYVYDHCQPRFQRFLGADDSLVLRTTLSWVWFRPSQTAWDHSSHTWRCDVVGGTDQSAAFTDLPRTARGLLLGKPDDRWLTCVDAPSVTGSVKIPCSRRHTWRAVTTVVLGKKHDAYPGDRLSEVRTRDFCSNSVGAWLNYPVDYGYAYTWFHAAEWKTGNRRSICWARTSQ